MNDHCPECGADSIRRWAWIYAHWPFHTTCTRCGANLRIRRNSFWLDVLCQFIASTLFPIAAIVGLFGSLGIALAIFGTAIILMYLPYLRGSFVVIRSVSNAAS